MDRSIRLFLVAGTLAAACVADDGGGNAEATTSATSGTGESGCQPGTEACPCIEDSPDGECVGDLVCLSNTCVRVPGGESGSVDPPTTTASTSPPGSTGELPECSGVFACEDGYVCVESECVHAWFLGWEMRVLYFEPPDCSETGGDLDPDYLVWRGDEKLTDAATSTCPGAWPDTTTMLAPFAPPPYDGFQIDFWDNDIGTPADLICSWVWDSADTGAAGPVPAVWLTDGGWSGTFDGGCYAEIEFTPL